VSRPLAGLVLLVIGILGLPAGASAAAVAAETLSDSTVVSRWTLANGLQVVSRHIPGAGAVAVTAGYRVGSDQDPANRPGLAQLLGLLAFTAPAGDVPERTREEIESQRPMGWSYPVSRRSTLLSEVATLEQFPGMLSQVAARMRGVQVSETQLRSGIAEVRRELGEQLFGRPDLALHFQVREVALGRTDEDLLRRAGGKELDGLTVQEIQGHLGRLYNPSNAVLAIVGNVSKVDLPALVQNLFGSIPAGTPPPPLERPALAPRSRLILRNDTGGSLGVVGIIGPALSDSLHPSFYLATLLFGTRFADVWKPKNGEPARIPFQFALFDEPELARFYPPVAPNERSTDALAQRLIDDVREIRNTIVPQSVYGDIKASVMWQFGGPLGSSILSQVRKDGSLLHQLARTEAARELQGGGAFWSDYRRRFESTHSGAGPWVDWFCSPERQVRLLFAGRS
jgi:hypothetical protein